MDYQTARLLIRDLRWDDLDAMHAYQSDPFVTRYTDFGVTSLAESREWLAGCIHHNNIPQRIAHNCAVTLLASGEAIGWLGFGPPSNPHDERGDIDFGYALRREFWGHGYMTEALAGMLDFIFNTTTAQRVFGECEVANPASARVMAKVGMALVARYTWQDDRTDTTVESLRYRIDKSDWQRTGDEYQP